MKHFVLVTWLIIGHISMVQAQLNIALNQIFKPNIRLRYQFMPTTQWADSTQLGYQQIGLASIIPLGGNAEVKLKELKVQAHQTFLNIAIGGRQVEISHLRENIRLGNGTLGITHVRGRVGKGVWVYSGQVGFLADRTITDRRNVFGLGAVAKVQIKGLRKQNIYGVAVAFSPVGILPVPILGWNRKLAKRWDLSILLPVQANISYKAGKKTTFEWQNTFNALAFPIHPQNLRYDLPTAQFAQYLDVRSSIELTQKINRNWHLVGELGCTPYRRLQWNNADRKTIQSFSGGALGVFATIGIRLNLPQGWLSSQMFESE
jgi:hypothetical protein